MRKTLLGLMLAATAAVPSLASAQQGPEQQHRQRGDWNGRRGGGGGEQRPERQQGGQVQQPQQVRQDGPQPGWQQRQAAPQGGWQQRQDYADRNGGRGNQQARDGGAAWQRGGDIRQQGGREVRPYAAGGNRFADRGQWSRNWRGDDRYDYRDYRSGNRGAFHLPRYYAPRGWDGGYRRFAIGYRLSPVLFDDSYWIDDPYDYRLPPAYGPYRWVRYYDDALLVDLRSGYVVDTVYDIFY